MRDPLTDAIEELGVRCVDFRRTRSGRIDGPALLLVEDASAQCNGRVVAPAEVVVVLTPLALHLHGELTVGALSFDAPDHPMLASLPPLMHLRSAGAYLSALRAELAAPTDGSAGVLARLSEILLIEAIRSHAHSAEECPAGGWFRGLRDPSLSRALSAFHADVAGPWTVASMARVAGQSRSRFAARFSAVMGEAPLSFVTRWRMFHARRLLRTTDASLEQIASRVGYASAAAFSVAFGRAHGEAPGAYRSGSSTLPTIASSTSSTSTLPR